MDLGSGIDPTTVTLKLDGQTDKRSPYHAGQSAVYSIPPGDALSEGLHQVTVTATDWRGNATTQTWSFTVNDHPQIEFRRQPGCYRSESPQCQPGHAKRSGRRGRRSRRSPAPADCTVLAPQRLKKVTGRTAGYGRPDPTRRLAQIKHAGTCAAPHSGSLRRLRREPDNSLSSFPAEWAARMPSFNEKRLAHVAAARDRDISRDRAALEKSGAQMVTMADAVYPANLRQLPDAPPVLLVRATDSRRQVQPRDCRLPPRDKLRPDPGATVCS